MLSKSFGVRRKLLPSCLGNFLFPTGVVAVWSCSIVSRLLAIVEASVMDPSTLPIPYATQDIEDFLKGSLHLHRINLQYAQMNCGARNV